MTLKEDLAKLISYLDSRGQRESQLLKNLEVYDGLSHWLPKHKPSKVENQILHLRDNLLLSSSTRVRDGILKEIRELEIQMIPTDADLSGITRLNGMYKGLVCDSEFRTACKLLTVLSKRLSLITDDEKLASKFIEEIKNTKEVANKNMKKGWKMILVSHSISLNNDLKFLLSIF